MFNILIPAGGGTTTVVQSNPALLNNTEANSANILAAVDALAAAIFTDSGAFTVAVSKLIAMGFLVNPTDVLTAGEIGAPAMDEYRGLWNAVADRIAKVNKVRETFPDNWVKKPYESLVSETNIAAATYRVEIDMDGYDNATIDVICSGGVSVDIFGTDNPDADDTADTGWVSLSGTTITDTTDGWALTGQEAWRKLMIKYVTSDTSNAIDIDVNLGG
jgi:hypothetical protein